MSKSKQHPLFLHQTFSQIKKFAKIKSGHDLRLKVRDAFFGDYSADVEDGRIDFLVYYKWERVFTETFLWAESKDKPADVLEMFAQLLLTVKKKSGVDDCDFYFADLLRRDEKGRMKSKATGERFNELDAALRLARKKLAVKIQPKVYEYGFLKESREFLTYH